MKTLLHSLVDSEKSAFHRRRLAREYLQARILYALQGRGAFSDWAFVGGTALRFLYRLPRFSEDLDFSLSASERDSRFEVLMRGVKTDLCDEGYTVDIRIQVDRNVKSAWIKIQNLLHEIRAGQKSENLSIKVELDSQPPSGASFETTLIRNPILLHLFHYDKSSLFAGKLHAIFARPYTKGRDLFDLLWYLSDTQWPAPNIPFLNSALQQTGWPQEEINLKNWKRLLWRHLQNVDWKIAIDDVNPFVENEQDIRLLNHDTFYKLLKK